MDKPAKNRIIRTVVRAVLAVLTVVFGFTAVSGRLPDDRPDGFMRAVFFDAGEGDCAIVICGDSVVVIDAAEGGSEQAIGYMQRLGIGHVDYMIVTHFDRDHAGDVPKIMNEFSVYRLLMPEPVDTSIFAYRNIVGGVSGEEIIYARTGQSYVCGELRIDVLAPNAKAKKDNETSIVCRISRGGKAVLLCADASAAEEKTMLSKYGSSMRSDVIKIAHHGSDYSSSDDFLRAVSPSFAVISCGRNSYGHPSMRVISTLKALGADVAITQGDGVVIYDIFPDRVERKK
ncbi:MAG: MBL fold metallo-hydrolase [Clostridia bacterium]|nr:MBL fold metallo-hydrolase [Clostridia bacterium]